MNKGSFGAVHCSKSNGSHIGKIIFKSQQYTYKEIIRIRVDFTIKIFELFLCSNYAKNFLAYHVISLLY